MMQTATFALVAALLAAGMDLPKEPDRDQREAMRHYRAGQDAMAHEQYEAAAEEFRTAIKLDSLLLSAHYGLGQAYMALKRYPDAIRALVRCRDAFHEEDAEALTDRLASDRRINDQIMALEEHIRVLRRMASGTTFRAFQAQRSIDLKEEEIRSLRTRRKRTVDTPSATPAWLSLALGSAYFRNSDLEQAEKEYKAALAVKPGLAEAHNNLAVVYLLTARVREAEAAVAAAEKAGFSVHPQLKQDIAARKQGP